MSNKWDAHCVDSWVLATVGLKSSPEVDKTMIVAKPLRFYRRQLHVFVPSKGGIRKNYGSTRSLGFRRGSIVKNKKYGITIVGGTSKGRITLCSLASGKRLSKSIKPENVKFLAYNNWRQYV